MHNENAKSRAAYFGRHNHEDAGRSHDAVYVWRVLGNVGTRFRFCCRMGRLSVYEEPSERRVLTVNVGRLAEVARRARLMEKSLKASLPFIRELTREEEIACWAKAADNPETRFFETLEGGPGRLGGRWQTQRALEAVLEASGRKAPWPGPPRRGLKPGSPHAHLKKVRGAGGAPPPRRWNHGRGVGLQRRSARAFVRRFRKQDTTMR